jgi:hypothetical protein
VRSTVTKYLVAIDNIFEDFIQCMAHMKITISIRWAIVKNKCSLIKQPTETN